MNKTLILLLLLCGSINLVGQNRDIVNIVDIVNKTPNGNYLNNTITVFTCDVDKSLTITNDTIHVKITVFPQQNYQSYPDSSRNNVSFTPGLYFPILISGNKTLPEQEKYCFQAIFLCNDKGIGGEMLDDIFFGKCNKKPPPFTEISLILKQLQGDLLPITRKTRCVHSGFFAK